MDINWVVGELVGADFKDIRLTDRLMTTVERFAERPNASIPEAAHNKSEAKAMYRFFDNDAVTPASISEPHRERTKQRAAEHEVVLVVQDRTEIDLTAHPATKGLGYLTCPYARGLLAHNLLCLSADGVPLGLLDQFVWTRPIEELGKKRTRDRRETKNKESQRWLDGLRSVERHLPKHPQVVLIGDRESDLFDLFAAKRPANVDLLARIRDQRRHVEHPAKQLGAAMAQEPPRMELRITVPRGDDRSSREATLTLRWRKLTICRPANHRGPAPSSPVTLWFVDAKEEHPPPGHQAIHWLLATTLEIHDEQDALRVLQWYTYRWRIERFHFVLKSGCGIERHRLETDDRTRRLLATISIVAWRLLWLTYEARRDPDAACTRVFSTEEWQMLHFTTQRKRDPLPTKPPTLATVVRQLACLGGFLNRKHDGQPGVKVLWRGLRRLEDLVTGYKAGKTQGRSKDSKEDYG